MSSIGAAGFGDPVTASQHVFRVLLDAMARPGRILAVPPLAAPAGLSAASASVLLTLADFETPVWLGGECAEAAAWLRFHSGAPVTDTPGEAAFAVIGRGDALPPLAGFSLGTEEYPEKGATLVIELSGLDTGGDLVLKGPGIDGAHRLEAAGLPTGFWRERAELAELFPRGLDLILTCGERLAAVPRTTTVIEG
jgi:alpha-D-ribose 1-methylphosphonate 5-triphosphate synthase subunit PhnH